MSKDFPIKLNVPQYVLEIPSTKEKVSFRPFLVGEQKSMMLALATDNTDTIVNAIKSLIEACSYEKVNTSKLAPFDLEYLFLQLRSRSIGENVALIAKCSSCNNEFQFKADISKAEVDFSTNQSNKIQLTDEIGVQMRYPTLEENLKLYSNNKDQTILLETVIDCIDKIWNTEELINTEDYPRESSVKFVNALTVDQADKLCNFVLLMPSVKVIETAKCTSCGHSNNILIEGLENFFG